MLIAWFVNLGAVQVCVHEWRVVEKSTVIDYMMLLRFVSCSVCAGWAPMSMVLCHRRF